MCAKFRSLASSALPEDALEAIEGAVARLDDGAVDELIATFSPVGVR
jgi:hypothetical protein